MRLNRRRKSRGRDLTVRTSTIDCNNHNAGLERKIEQLELAMLDSQHRLDFSEYRRYSRFDLRRLFSRSLYHTEMIELRRYLRNAAVIFFAASIAACHVTKNVHLVENSDATSRPSRIEVTTRSGSTFFIYQPVVQGDSVRGFSDEARKSPTAIAVSEIANAQTRAVSSGRTALLVFGIVAAVAGTLFILAVMAVSSIDYN